MASCQRGRHRGLAGDRGRAARGVRVGVPPHLGLTIPDVGLQIVTWRLSAVSAAAEFEPTPVAAGSGASPAGQRPVVFERNQPARDVDVYKRAALGAGDTFDGPAIVEERETTVVIRPGWHVEVAGDGSLIATRSTGSAS